jgi:hypothetical protein
MVKTQESTQSLAALNRPVAADVCISREQQSGTVQVWTEAWLSFSVILTCHIAPFLRRGSMNMR